MIALQVEVKGPRDKLDERQKAWLHQLSQHGVDARVCKVLEQGKDEDGEKGKPAAKRSRKE